MKKITAHFKTFWNRAKLAAQIAQERRELANMDPALIRDLGLNPADINLEAQRPFWDIPAERLSDSLHREEAPEETAPKTHSPRMGHKSPPAKVYRLTERPESLRTRPVTLIVCEGPQPKAA